MQLINRDFEIGALFGIFLRSAILGLVIDVARRLLVSVIYSLATSEVKDYINAHFPHFRHKKN